MKFQAAVKLGVKVAKGQATSEEKQALGIFFVVASKRTMNAFEKALTKALTVENRGGCIELRKTRSGRQVGLYRSLEGGIETDPELPWSTICEDHGGVVSYPTRETAEANLSHPEEWCPVCQGEEPEP